MSGTVKEGQFYRGAEDGQRCLKQGFRQEHGHQGKETNSEGKESACNAGDQGLIPESERSPGEGNGNPLQYSCLENPTDRGAWQGPNACRCKELDMTE